MVQRGARSTPRLPALAHPWTRHLPTARPVVSCYVPVLDLDLS